MTYKSQHCKMYNLWSGMIQRCHNPNNQYYPRYGGRGIKVCERWRKFKPFLEDMGDKPDEMCLDRIDNNKGYSKENCKWSTMLEQANNRSDNRHITYKGKTKTLSQWDRELGFTRGTIRMRHVVCKWPIKLAMETAKQTKSQAKLKFWKSKLGR